MHTIAITGASGYIGIRLLTELTRTGCYRVKVLSRSRHQDLFGAAFEANIEFIEGDLLMSESLWGFLEPGCTVVNLAYLWDAGEEKNLTGISNLLEACKVANVGRLIHCSTAAVVGRASSDHITEDTFCRPVTDYGITKLRIEEVITSAAHDCFDIAILRPTSVFGPEGNPLKKLSGDLVTGNRLHNYLKSCLFGRRRMNLVHVANVVASILFLIGHTERLRGEILIVSDDDSPSNNFADVERFLMREFGIPDYSFPRLQVPLGILSFLLTCLGRNNTNPLCNYSSDKLLSLGFKRAISFETGLAEYASWYRSTFLNQPVLAST